MALGCGKTAYFALGEWPDLTAKAARAALAKRKLDAN
jgi:hypothetical protein